MDNQKKKIRRWRRKHHDTIISDEEILGILSKGRIKGKETLSLKLLKLKGKKKNIEISDSLRYNYRVYFKPGATRCFVCNQLIDEPHEASVIVGKGGYLFYHSKKCGPHTKLWVMNHPTFMTLLAHLQILDKNVKGGDLEYSIALYKKFRGKLFDPRWGSNEVLTFLSWHQKFNEEVVNMSKKEKEGKKEGKGSGLVPKEPIQVPKELLRHKALGPILKKMKETDDDMVKRECRKELRALGFKLSDESTWKPFLKELGKGKSSDDDDDDEEEEKHKKSPKKDKKRKNKKEVEEEEDEEEEKHKKSSKKKEVENEDDEEEDDDD